MLLVVRRTSVVEGLWFAVPLRGGGYGAGLVARVNRGGVLLGYFFGPKRQDVPTLDAVAVLRPDDAVLVQRFGHLGLEQGTWPALGKLPDWDRTVWPMPVFVRFEELSGRSLHVYYDDDDPNRIIRETQVAPGTAEHGPRDGLFTAGAAEKVLTGLLSP